MSNYLPEGVSDEDYETGQIEDEEEDYFDCGEDFNGGCSLAGTEECDFECPNRDSMIARLDRKNKLRAR